MFDALGHAFLSDFGVAKVLASAPDKAASRTAMTGAGMVLGTPEYMAPELIMGEPFDGRVDQYALAVTVYELLCGRRPFEDEAKTKVLVLQTTKAPPRLTDWAPDLPERLSKAVLRGLSKDPDERYANCAAFAGAVVIAADGAPAGDARVSAQRDSAEQASTRDPMSAPSGTVAISRRKGHGKQPTGPEPGHVPASRASRTLVGHAASPSNQNADARVFQDLDNSGADNALAHSTAHAIQPRTLVIVGAGALCVLLVLGLAYAWLRPGNVISATDSARALEVARPVAASSGPASVVSPAPANPAQLPEPPSAKAADASGSAPSTQPSADRLVDRTARPDTGASGREADRRPSTGGTTTKNPAVKKTALEPPPPNIAVAAVSAPDSRADRNTVVQGSVSTERFSSKSRRRPATLWTRSTPSLGPYVGQIVIPSGMYNLASSPVDRPGGPRKLLVTQWRIEERTNKPLDVELVYPVRAGSRTQRGRAPRPNRPGEVEREGGDSRRLDQQGGAFAGQDRDSRSISNRIQESNF